MNATCPECSRPIITGPVIASSVRFCKDQCVRDWFTKHNRRTGNRPVALDRRRSL